MALPTKGTLDEQGFIQLLKEAAESKLTGMIRLEKGPIIKVVYVQQGTIAFASSNEKSDRLTEVLKRAGKLTTEQIEDAQARLKPNVSLGKTLVQLGYISPKDLLWGARAQVEGILHQLLFWKDGNYQILEGPLPKEVVSLGLPVPQVLYDGVLRSQDRDWVLEQIVSPQAVFELSSDFHEKNAAWKLPAEAVVSRINGKRPLEDIAQSAGLDTFEVCKTVAALQLLGLVQRVQEQPIQMPLLVTHTGNEQSLEVGSEEAVETAGVSLGQVLQIPTMEELQEEPEEEQEQAKQTVRLTQQQPPAPMPVSIQSPKEEEEGEEAISFLENSSVKEMHPKHAPLLGFSANKYPGRKPQINWRTMAIIMGVSAILALGGAMYYFHLQKVSLSEAKSVVPERPVKKQPQAAQSENPEEMTLGNEPDTTEQPVETPQPAATTKPPAVQPTETKKPPEPAPQPSSTPLQILQQGRLPDAAAAWDAELRNARSKYTIQLEIACQESTVREAVGMVDSANLLVVPLVYHGQSCYRILYGTYTTESSAEAARVKLPAVFLKQEAPARVVQVSKLLK